MLNCKGLERRRLSLDHSKSKSTGSVHTSWPELPHAAKQRNERRSRHGLEAFVCSESISSELAADKKLSKASCLFLESPLLTESFWTSERPSTKWLFKSQLATVPYMWDMPGSLKWRNL